MNHIRTSKRPTPELRPRRGGVKRLLLKQQSLSFNFVQLWLWLPYPVALARSLGIPAQRSQMAGFFGSDGEHVWLLLILLYLFRVYASVVLVRQ